MRGYVLLVFGVPLAFVGCGTTGDKADAPIVKIDAPLTLPQKDYHIKLTTFLGLKGGFSKWWEESEWLSACDVTRKSVSAGFMFSKSCSPFVQNAEKARQAKKSTSIVITTQEGELLAVSVDGAQKKNWPSSFEGTLFELMTAPKPLQTGSTRKLSPMKICTALLGAVPLVVKSYGLGSENRSVLLAKGEGAVSTVEGLTWHMYRRVVHTSQKIEVQCDLTDVQISLAAKGNSTTDVLTGAEWRSELYGVATIESERLRSGKWKFSWGSHGDVLN